MAPAAVRALAAFGWDPQVRGILIVGIGVSILIGSVYMLLMTNTGARVGFLLAVAGLSGWVTILSIVWSLFAIGLQGRPPSWKALEVSYGTPSRLGESALPSGRGLPDTLNGQATKGWKSLPAGNPVRGDATAAADKILAPDTAAAKEGASKSQPKIAPPFSSPGDYVQVGAFEKNGKQDATWFQIHHHRFYNNGPAWNPIGWFRHEPHYVVLVVQKANKTPAGPQGSAGKPQPDVSQPFVSLLMVRDLGSLRFPPLMIALSSGLVFAITCYALHTRDKEIMAARAAGATPSASPAPTPA